MLPLNVAEFVEKALIWDNHGCMPLRPEESTLKFLPLLQRYREGGVDVASLNVTFDIPGVDPLFGFRILSLYRRFILDNPEDYLLINTVDDIDRAHNVRTHNGSLVAVVEQNGVDLALDLHHGIDAAEDRHRLLHAALGNRRVRAARPVVDEVLADPLAPIQRALWRAHLLLGLRLPLLHHHLAAQTLQILLLAAQIVRHRCFAVHPVVGASVRESAAFASPVPSGSQQYPHR